MESERSIIGTFFSQNKRSRALLSAPNLNWSTLPQELLDLILKKMVSLTDYLQFSATCHHWCSAALADCHRWISSCNNTQLPLLLIPPPNSRKTRKLYNITRNTHLDVDWPLPVPFNERFCGSSHGWLIYLDVRALEFTLINPFSNGKINFPYFPDDLAFLEGENEHGIEHAYVHKAVLSADPNSSLDEYFLAVIYGHHKRLALYRCFEESWAQKNRLYKGFHDVIFSKSQELCYAVCEFWGVFIFSLLEPYSVKMIVRRSIGQVVTQPSIPRRYLVELPNGDLLEVLRLFRTGEDQNLRFRVFKIQQSERIWVELETLGDWSLFLGNNHSVSVRASDYVGCKRGCIYFTMEMSQGYNEGEIYEANWPMKMLVYNLEENDAYMRDLTEVVGDDHEEHLPPAIWIVPTLRGGGN